MQLPRDETHVATSTDGIRWTIRGRIAEKASVPDVLLTSSGEVRAYWVDFSAFTGPLTEQIGTGRSIDGGVTWGQ
jgi:hypothetical protein